eukprot:gb/GEZN01004778.1/.p1 GENE.gb/GEZN01004778.1/~~gb/GEZN01004778.1/.p1  ORF type:complete len:452 (+),score=85.41 gb/GEZN01004778.1/:284-1639(+)
MQSCVKHAFTMRKSCVRLANSSSSVTSPYGNQPFSTASSSSSDSFSASLSRAEDGPPEPSDLVSSRRYLLRRTIQLQQAQLQQEPRTQIETGWISYHSLAAQEMAWAVEFIYQLSKAPKEEKISSDLLCVLRFQRWVSAFACWLVPVLPEQSDQNWRALFGSAADSSSVINALRDHLLCASSHTKTRRPAVWFPKPDTQRTFSAFTHSPAAYFPAVQQCGGELLSLLERVEAAKELQCFAFNPQVQEGFSFHSFDRAVLAAFLQWPAVLKTESVLASLTHLLPRAPCSSSSASSSVPSLPAASSTSFGVSTENFWSRLGPVWVLADRGREFLAERDYHTDFKHNYLLYQPGSRVSEANCSPVLFAAPDVAQAWRNALPPDNPFATAEGGRVTRVANTGQDLLRSLKARGDKRCCFVFSQLPEAEAVEAGKEEQRELVEDPRFLEVWLPVQS